MRLAALAPLVAIPTRPVATLGCTGPHAPVKNKGAGRAVRTATRSGRGQRAGRVGVDQALANRELGARQVILQPASAGGWPLSWREVLASQQHVDGLEAGRQAAGYDAGARPAELLTGYQHYRV